MLTIWSSVKRGRRFRVFVGLVPRPTRHWLNQLLRRHCWLVAVPVMNHLLANSFLRSAIEIEGNGFEIWHSVNYERLSWYRTQSCRFSPSSDLACEERSRLTLPTLVATT